MHGRPRITLLIASMVASAFPLGIASAADLDTRVDQLERQVKDLQTNMDAMDGKLDAILKAVGQKSDAGDEQPAFKPAPVTGEKHGLTLNLAVIKKADITMGTVVDGPGQNLVASAVVEKPSDFNFTQFLALPEMQNYQTLQDGYVGQYWTGTLNIPSSGTAGFSAEIYSEEDKRLDCIAMLEIDDQKVVSTEIKQLKRDHGGTNQGTANLSQGKHKLSFWTFCAPALRYTYNDLRYEKLQFALKMKLPSDEAPKPIPLEYFSAK